MKPTIVQNGIDLESIIKINNESKNIQSIKRIEILSIRGITPIYRIKDIIKSRNISKKIKIQN